MRHSNDMMLSVCYVNMFLRQINSVCMFHHISLKFIFKYIQEAFVLTVIARMLFDFFSLSFPIRYYVIRISIDATQKFSNFFLFFRRTLLHSVQIRFEYYISIGMACAFFLHFIAEEAVENVTFPLKIPSQNEQHFSINFMRFSTVCLQFYNFFLLHRNYKIKKKLHNREHKFIKALK